MSEPLTKVNGSAELAVNSKHIQNPSTAEGFWMCFELIESTK